MAVPKRRISKAKKNMRKSKWKQKAFESAKKALSLGESLKTEKYSGFFYPLDPLPRPKAEGFKN